MREKIFIGVYFTVLALFIVTGYRVGISRPGAVIAPPTMTVQNTPRVELGVNIANRCDDIVRYPDGSLVCEIEMSAEDVVIGN